MERTEFVAPTPGGGWLGGWLAGEGAPVLLAHGGPGLSYDHLDAVVWELAEGFRVATYQQRGLPPSTTEGAFTVAEAVADVVAVLDHLGWDRAWFVGHSWGGHLGFHVAEALPSRLLGVLSIDPLGGVGDGGAQAFAAEMMARVPAHLRARAEELDVKDMDGTATQAEKDETWDIIWPSYFGDQGLVMERPPMADSPAAHVGLWSDLMARLPDLEAGLPAVAVPVGVLFGANSPMPPDLAGGATAARIPGAWLELVPGAGAFPWFEAPGSVLRALRRLAAGT